MQPKLIKSIRELAVQYENVDLEGALELMNIALKYLPKDSLLRDKVKEYELRLQKNNKLKNLVKNRKVAIIPVGFRCNTTIELKERFSISQESLPFDNGFFPPQAVARLLEEKHIDLKYSDNGLTHRVCVKTEKNIDPKHGSGLKFATKTYEYINENVLSINQKNINSYLDSTFGYYTLDCHFNYVLAHYNWHKFSSETKSKGITDPKTNIDNISRILNKRIKRMLNLCDEAEYIFFVFQEKQQYKYMQIDEEYYFLNDYSALEKVCNKMFKNKYKIINLAEIESAGDLLSTIHQLKI
jgi:hypothetical protein